MRVIFLTIMSCLVLSSCVNNNGHYAALSTKPVSLYEVSPQKNIIKQNTSSVSSRHVMVFIPFSKAPTIGDAITQILNQYNGKYLTNVTIRRGFGQIMFWYGYDSWRISADVIG